MRRFVVIVALALAAAFALGAADSASSRSAASGGTLRVVNPGGPPVLDPALNAAPLGWGALWYATCATLFAFHDAPSPEGFTVHPEAAEGASEISRNGLTYVLTVRRGLRFNNGARLSAANFARALGRVLNPIMRSEGAALFSDVKRVAASGRRLRIDLRKPTASLPTRLALPYACPVPPAFPVDPAGVSMTVGSGPYYVARYEMHKQLVLERNRYYRGSRPHRVDRIVLTIGGDLQSNIAAVADGRADVLATELPSEVRPDLAGRYGVNEDQFFVTRGTSITVLALNTSRPLFRDNAPLRKAVNLAVDRSAIVRATPGWPVARTSTDQILTRWMPGWVDHHLYPLTRPNLDLARKLAAGNLRGGKAILWVSPAQGPLDRAEIVVRNLREIGLEVEVQPLANEVFNARAGTPGAAYDMALGTSPLNYPDPADVIVRLLAGENARKPADNTNYAYFDVPSYNRRMAVADRLTGSARARAFSELDKDIMRNEAPWAPLYEGASSLFVSARVACVAMHPVFRIDAAAMCLR